MLKNGAYVALLTPFKNGKINHHLMKEHLLYLLDRNIDGVCPCGTTGEFLALSLEEKCSIFKTVVELCQGKVSIICGIGDVRLENIIAAAAYAEKIGADALLLNTPFYYKFRQDEIFDFYQAVKKHSNLPLLCYNIPQFANNEIAFATYGKLCAANIVAGIKDSSGNRDSIRKMIELCAKGKFVYTGNDSFALESRKLGSNGIISAIGNVCPELFTRVWHKQDEHSQYIINKIRDEILKVGFIVGLKQCLTVQGFDYHETRIPFVPPQKSEIERLNRYLEALKREGGIKS